MTGERLFILMSRHLRSCDLFSFLLSMATWSVFGSVVAGAFQIAFCAEMHANDVFLFFKNYF